MVGATTIIVVGLSLLVVYLGISAYVASVAVRTRRLPLLFTPTLPREDVSFASRTDGLLLRGWYFAAGPECVIVVCGGEQNRADPVTDTLSLATDLVESGYTVLLFDLRGRGESDGQGSIFPNNDRDVGGAVDFVRGRGHEDVKIIGFSSGAAATLLLANSESVTAVVSDSCFASARETFVRELAKRGCPRALAQVLSPGVSSMGRLVHGVDRMDPEAIVAQVSCPVFFIHGQCDSGVPVGDAYRLFHVRRNPANLLWVVPGAEHTQCYRRVPHEYVSRVIGFFAEVSRARRGSVL